MIKAYWLAPFGMVKANDAASTVVRGGTTVTMRNIDHEKSAEVIKPNVSVKSQETHSVKPQETHSPEYLKGYRDGVRDRQAARSYNAGDGVLGALLAIALIAGVGYFGYNYATTGRLLPGGVELNNFLSPSPAP